MSVILLDAGGVLLFPSPDLILPPVRAAGASPGPAELLRAHYRAMSACDDPGREAPSRRWWYEYLCDYVAACGIAPATAGEVAEKIEEATQGFSWNHVGPGVGDALADLAALGLPMGIVSNSTGEVAEVLASLDVCYAVDGQPVNCHGVEVGVVIDSAVVGVSKPDPAIFSLALEALRMPDVARNRVVHVGDSLRYDVTGAIAAGVRPVHLDPYGYCPAPEGHEHIRRLADLAALVSG